MAHDETSEHPESPNMLLKLTAAAIFVMAVAGGVAGILAGTGVFSSSSTDSTVGSTAQETPATQTLSRRNTAAPTASEAVSTVSVSPGLPAVLVSADGRVVVQIQAGSVDRLLHLTYEPLRVEEIPQSRPDLSPRKRSSTCL